MNDAKVRIFVSSPADVEHERAMVKDILERLAGEFLPYFQVDPILWEDEALTADRTFQAGMVRPSDCDIVLVVLWTRLGSPLPQNPYQGRTGTEWEFFDAVDASAADDGGPEVLVYKKTNPKLVDITNPQQTLKALEERKRLEEFFHGNFFNEDQTFRRAFRSFDSDTAFRNLVEIQLRKLLNRRIFVERRGPGRAFAWSGSPFRPHGPFDFGDERVFTGREGETRELVGRLHRQIEAGASFLLLSGASGSGKTSLVRAGLLPRLVRPHQVPGVAACRWCLVNPAGGVTPLAALAQALCSKDALGDRLADVGVDAGILCRSLETDSELAVSQIRAALETLTRAYRDDTGEHDASVRLAVVVDPLDTLLGNGRSHEVFFSALAALAHSGAVWVIALARSDRLRDLGRSDVLDELVRESDWLGLEPIPASRSRQVIEIPALVAGLGYGSEADPKLPELLEAQTAGVPLWAPLTQGILQQLFQRQLSAGHDGSVAPLFEGGEMAPDGHATQPTAAGLQALGGLAGDALRRAEQVWSACSEETRAALPRLCRALIALENPSARDPVPRVADLDLLESDAAGARLIQALIDARVLVAEGKPDPILLMPCEETDDSLRAWFGRTVRDTRDGLRTRIGREEEARTGDAALGEAPSIESGAESVADQDWQTYRRTVTLVHPALIRLWHPLANWLAMSRNRNDLVLRGQIARQTRLWKRTDCNREHLLGEGGYAAASRFEAAHGDELEPAERELLARSNRYLLTQRRGKRLVRATGLVLVSLLVLVTSVAKWAWDASRSATVNLHVSRLKAADLAVTRGNTPDAVALALDAAPYLPRQAANVLSRALTGSHLVALAHEGPPLDGLPLSAALDATGKRLLTADPSVGLRFWRLEDAALRPEQSAWGAELGIHRVLFVGGDTVGSFLGVAPGGVWRLPLAGQGSEPDYGCGAEPGALYAPDPTGRRLALSGARSIDRDAICVLDLAGSGEVAFDLTPHEGEVRSLVFSPDGNRLLSAGSDGWIKVLDAVDGRVLLTLPLDGPLRPTVNRAVFDASGERIAVAASDGRVRIYDSLGAQIRKLDEVEDGGALRRVHESEVRDLVFSPHGDYLLAVDDDGQVVRWNLSGEPSAFVLGHHDDTVDLLRISPEGSRVLTASRDRSARLWDLETGRQQAVFSHDGVVSEASFTSDGQRVLTLSGEDGSARLWSAKPVMRLGRILHHDDHVRHLAIGKVPGTRSLRLATASSNGVVRVWDLSREDAATVLAEPLVLSGHARGVRRLDFSPDGMHLASAGQDGDARVWNIAPGDTGDRTLCRLPVSDSGRARVHRVRFDPSSRSHWLLSASDQLGEPLRLRDAETCDSVRVEAVTDVAGSGIRALAVRRVADGVLVAAGSDDGRLWVLFAADDGTWSRRCALRQHTRAVLDVDISPDGGLVASASEDRWARVLDVASCTGDASSMDLVGHSDTLRSVRFSAGGRRLVTSSLDGTARIWDVSGEMIAVLADHRNRVYHAEFGVGDRFVLTASRDGAVRVWQTPGSDLAHALQPDLVFKSGFGGVPYATFSPDGRYIAAGYWRNAAALWRLRESMEMDGLDEPRQRKDVWGESLYDLALIDAAWRFRRENRLDVLNAVSPTLLPKVQH